MSEKMFESTKNLSAEALMELLKSPNARESILAFSQQDVLRNFPELQKGGTL